MLVLHLSQTKRFSAQPGLIREFQRKVKAELMALTGMTKDQAGSDSSDSRSDAENDVASSSYTILVFHFDQNVDHADNRKILDRAATLIWKEQSVSAEPGRPGNINDTQSTKDPTLPSFSLPHKDVKFTIADLLAFGKNNLRAWTRTHKAANDPTLAAKKKKQEASNRRIMRQREANSISKHRNHPHHLFQLKNRRLAVVDEYEDEYSYNPACLLVTDVMTEEISEPDTDHESTKRTHRKLLIKKLKHPLESDEEDVAIWEVIKPEFQSPGVSFKSCDECDN